MSRTYQVVDLFAGPGGLAEGFSSFEDHDGNRPFAVTLSVEKERAAHQTLQLRAFLRQFDEFPEEYYDALNKNKPLPNWADLYIGEWETAEEEALCLTLGDASAATTIDARIDAITRLPGAETVLIGGPPCQAYALVGRARRRGMLDYRPEKDDRHFLYKEYIRILGRLRPVAFVMENVKGMLSSSVSGEQIFEQVLADLRGAGGEPDSYELFALALDPERRPFLRKTAAHAHFVIHAEDYGVAQTRQRVIIVGVRRDRAKHIASQSQTTGHCEDEPATVRDLIEPMPRLRSTLSQKDTDEGWRKAVIEQMTLVVEALKNSVTCADVLEIARKALEQFRADKEKLPRVGVDAAGVAETCPELLARWIEDPRLETTLNHESRAHMPGDFSRYVFCSAFSAAKDRSPKAREFPQLLAPDHKNWTSGIFADRFRAQCWDGPATTITSHIAKDGHYFIHPDLSQCRSLTVREAARLQSFPDNYLFLGSRTEQYVQVGNAVPPFLARQIAEVLWRSLDLKELPKQSGVGAGAHEAVSLQD